MAGDLHEIKQLKINRSFPRKTKINYDKCTNIY